MPWAVVSAGAVVTATGGVLYNQASNEYAKFDDEFDEICGPGGCYDSELPAELASRLERGRTLETVSRISLITGGVVIIGGAALVFLNQTAEPGNERATARTFLVPTLGPQGAGIAAGISF